MAFVVTDNCIKCKYTDCVAVCPVDCFREGESMLVIDPEECIDCNLCVPECPVDAISSEEDLPEDKKKWISINLEMSKKWPSITNPKDALPDADIWAGKTNKEKYLNY